jgi:YegS/Rv2252/BmrU family lipid kinase
MTSKKKMLFIINPISGENNKVKLIKSIPKIVDSSKFDISITHTKHAGEAIRIAKKAVEANTDIIGAVGGDGTVNEIASQLVNTDTALTIVPLGSGNGLAHDLGIPLNYKKAIQQIKTLRIKQIDVGVCNHQYFFSLIGVGFDAKVAYDYNRRKKRRFLGYFWAICKNYFNYKEEYYEIDLENEKITDKFFFINIANSSQWGYNVKVAPNAKLDDGIFTVNLCKKPSFFYIIPFAIKLLLGRIDTSKYVTLKTSNTISIEKKKKIFYHIDGDAKGISCQFNIKILHKALHVIMG